MWGRLPVPELGATPIGCCTGCIDCFVVLELNAILIVCCSCCCTVLNCCTVPLSWDPKGWLQEFGRLALGRLAPAKWADKWEAESGVLWWVYRHVHRIQVAWSIHIGAQICSCVCITQVGQPLVLHKCHLGTGIVHASGWTSCGGHSIASNKHAARRVSVRSAHQITHSSCHNR